MAANEARLTVLLAMHGYNSGVAAQYFDYREKITATVVLAYAGLIGVMATLQFSIVSVPIGISISIVAQFSEFFVMKFYERSEHHFARCRGIRKEIDREFGKVGNSLEDIFSRASEQHLDRFSLRNRSSWVSKVLSSNTHDRWGNIHSMFFWIGLVLVAIAIIKFAMGIDWPMNFGLCK